MATLTTSHQSNHLSRTNESKHDKHSYEEGKVPDHQHVPEQSCRRPLASALEISFSAELIV
jgi:hypothetical protein